MLRRSIESCFEDSSTHFLSSAQHQLGYQWPYVRTREIVIVKMMGFQCYNNYYNCCNDTKMQTNIIITTLYKSTSHDVSKD